MILERIKEYPDGIANVFRRFPLALFFSLAATVIFILDQTIRFRFTRINGVDCIKEWLLYYPLGAMGIAFAVSLVFETVANKRFRVLTHLSANLFWAALCAILIYCYGSLEDESLRFSLSACYVTIFSAPIIMPFLKQENDTPLWFYACRLLSNTALAASISLVFFGILWGLMDCIFSLVNYQGSNSPYFEDIAIFSFCFLTPLLALSAQPHLKSEAPAAALGKIREFSSRYILPIIVGTFLIIMYAHVVKAFFVSDKLGDISVYAAYAMASVFALALIQFPKFNRIFPLASIPLLVAYAIDAARFTLESHNNPSDLYFVLFCIWSIFSVAVLLRKPERSIRWMIISFCAIFLVGSIGPQRMGNIARIIPEKEVSDRSEDPSVSGSPSQRIEFGTHHPKVPVSIPDNRSKAINFSFHDFDGDKFEFNDNAVSFPIRSNPHSATEITRFTVPLDEIRKMEQYGGDYLFENDSASIVITDFSLTITKYTRSFTCEGVLFLK